MNIKIVADIRESVNSAVIEEIVDEKLYSTNCRKFAIVISTLWHFQQVEQLQLISQLAQR